MSGRSGGSRVAVGIGNQVVRQPDLTTHVEEDVSLASSHHFWFTGRHSAVVEMVPLPCAHTHTNTAVASVSVLTDEGYRCSNDPNAKLDLAFTLYPLL